MAVSYSKLFALMEAKGVKKYGLRKNGIHAAVVDKLVKGGTIDTTTIGKLCDFLNCQPGDILENIPGDAIGRMTRGDSGNTPTRKGDR